MTDTITVVGNIATNPERRPAGAVSVTSFRVATTERRLDAHGAWVDAHTNYYSISAFRSLGENAFVSLRRGDRVIVSGRLRLKEWTAADGSKGRTVEIDADALGHDLRFGTTVFQRSTRPEAHGTDTPGTDTPGEDGSRESGWPAVSTPDAWATPGVAADDAVETGVAPQGDDGVPPAGSASQGGHDRALAVVGADTPF